MELKKIQERTTEVTEGMKNVSLEKENKGSNLFSLIRCMLARELFAF